MEHRKVARLFSERTGKTVLVPLDHGLAQGPMSGLRNIPQLLPELAAAGVDAVVLNPGMAALCAEVLARHPRLGLIVHLSAGSGLAQDGRRRGIVTSVEAALRLGADAVSVHVNLGSTDDLPQLRELADTSEQCRRLGMPLLAMTYVPAAGAKVDSIAHAARMAVELGADIVKIPYPGAVGLRAIVEAVPRPVVCAGGAVGSCSLVEIAHAVRDTGAAGVAIGRQVFDDPDPSAVARQLVALLQERDPSVRPAAMPRGRRPRAFARAAEA